MRVFFTQKKKRQLLFAMFALLTTLVVWNYQLLVYGMEQGYGQLRIVLNAREVPQVLADENFPDTLKEKLRLIQEIRAFAVEKLGIKNSDNYTTVYNQHGQPLLWVLTASEAYRLKPFSWKFPLIGAFSYKGFFNKPRALTEESGLKKNGYDTQLASVSGWSTLGWFRDPILTNMLKRKEGDLASLIIHELTHQTLYIKDSVNYNENLANFVGDYGARLFLQHKYGESSLPCKQFEQELHDEKIYIKHILRGAHMLDSLYASFSVHDNKIKKDSLKRYYIKKIMTTADTLSLFNKEKYLKWSRSKKLPNNAFFIDYKRYNEKQDIFEEELNRMFGGDFSGYLSYLKRKYPSL